MRTRIVAFIVALALTSDGAIAEVVPEKSKFDGRIRTVAYNPADVVRIDTAAGVNLMMVFADGEAYVDHAFGDGEAYLLSHRANVIFLKARLPDTCSG